MNNNQSIENYLETILILTNRGGKVRSIDIANQLSYSKPSVSIANKKLVSLNYIEIDEQGEITLTDTGRKLASAIYERHTILSECLKSLGVDEKIAKEDACLIEHVISQKSFDAIRKYYTSKRKD